MKFLYSLSFLLGMDNWKLSEMPGEISDTLLAFDKDQTQILDLGCGKGQECVSLALKGWHVIGVDFIPLAIQQAKRAAAEANVLDRTTFVSGDVSDLPALNLPAIQFAYDIGCFHLLDSKQVMGYLAGVSKVLISGGLFLLNAFTPRQQGRKMVGYTEEEIKELFCTTFDLEKVSDHSYWRFPANWYWLRKL
jgi:cyclopropane fatty-acyl-phospholipid synthase-like methyltransferase